MNGIIANGRWRLLKAIEAEVRREYARELAAASSLWKRLMIQKKIQGEIKRRINQQAPRDALYLSQRLKLR